MWMCGCEGVCMGECVVVRIRLFACENECRWVCVDCVGMN